MGKYILHKWLSEGVSDVCDGDKEQAYQPLWVGESDERSRASATVTTAASTHWSRDHVMHVPISPWSAVPSKPVKSSVSGLSMVSFRLIFIIVYIHCTVLLYSSKISNFVVLLRGHHDQYRP